MNKWVVSFKKGNAEQATLLGGKGANLAEMTAIGLPVPQGFTITTAACLDYLGNQNKLQPTISKEISEALEALEKETDKRFGEKNHPLLVSVRSGAEISMPGMMDTILNLGLNDETVLSLAKDSGDERFAYDCYRRLLQMFGDVVFEIDHHLFEDLLTQLKDKYAFESDKAVTAKGWKELIEAYKGLYQTVKQREFPQDVRQQLVLAVEAVFKSWNNQRAKTYRRLHGISDLLGTAVNIQEMVFGNFGETSGTGVVFTRNPATGEKGLYGEYLMNAQGEDVVAGIRTPKNISVLADEVPEVFKKLQTICDKLEAHYKEMQDIEFTVEKGQLFILQTRNGKRTEKAKLVIALDLYREGLLTEQALIQKIEGKDLEDALHPAFTKEAVEKKIKWTSGLPASPGAAVGQLYFSAEQAVVAHKRGEKVILLRNETSPEDIEGMAISEAIVTCRGGMTSHAAVVARGMGICSVVGCEYLVVDENQKTASVEGTRLTEGAFLSVDGTTGALYVGELPLEKSNTKLPLKELFAITDTQSKIAVRGNAETEKDIRMAMELGATGIGLSRTEHMFFEKNRLMLFRQLILAQTFEDRVVILDKLKDVQKEDFKQMYQAAEGHPMTVRLLDPPLHEFLPKTAEEYLETAEIIGKSATEIQQKSEALAEVNPMLGFRGVRLGVAYPEIYQMQAEAIMEAAVESYFELNNWMEVEIMIPFTTDAREFKRIRQLLEARIQQVFHKYNQPVPYRIGTMIEIPRACLLADEIAKHADFFSFGTNDLTQMTYGLSRDDSPKIISQYMTQQLMKNDPFQVLDEKGVGALMKLAIEKGRSVKPDLKIGICGEAAAHPQSIEFLKTYAIDYISCSPYRIPQAKLLLAK
ncbi:pyruvate, phosphate dikinase [Enterococcus sp. AZ194]|uniref:pyruvate, phosphate dikinase n=1 Tax=Enterococcus sp. AZ194 TaxID=2774629 RepID=UPI003F2885ED